MSDLAELKRDWEELAAMDALWAIHSRPDKKFSKWSIEEFLGTGLVEVERILGDSQRLGRPRTRDTALDFGCGVGRLSGHLATHFAHVEAIDISEQMVKIGRALHHKVPNLTFRVNSDPDLRCFAAESFDMVCSIIVLQHLPGVTAIQRYLVEFIRVLRPGGLLVFQLPTTLPRVRLLLARRTPYLVLRRAGLPPTFLYNQLGLHPMRMTALATNRVTDFIHQSGGTLLDVVRLDKRDNLYYATR